MKSYRYWLSALIFLAFCGPLQAAPPTVLFDEGHAQQFVTGQQGDLHLSGLAAIFVEQGWRVATTQNPLNAGTLEGVDALVISGAFRPLAPQEIFEVTRFVSNGGRLAVMLHIGPPLKGLLERLQVTVSNGIIREQENRIHDTGSDFYVTRLAAHPLTAGLQRFGLFGGWALLAEGGANQVVAQTGPRAWVDLNRDGQLDPGDAQQAFAVAVAGKMGQGRYAVYGDDAVFQNRFLSDENRALAKNLAVWLRP